MRISGMEVALDRVGADSPMNDLLMLAMLALDADWRALLSLCRVATAIPQGLGLEICAVFIFRGDFLTRFLRTGPNDPCRQSIVPQYGTGR
jgi:hypothetical protein